MESVTITHTNSGTSVTILPYGATVLSFKDSSGREALFVSKTALTDGSAPVRGGIPLVFPIFGPPPADDDDDYGSSTMPQHGFARRNVWTQVPDSHFDQEDSAGISYQLMLNDVDDGRGTGNPWEKNSSSSYDCILVYSVTVKANELMTQLTVKNSGSASFPFQALFHTYYQIDHHSALNGEACYVKGLKGYTVADKVSSESYVQDNDNAITISQETDRVYSPPADAKELSVTIGVGPGKEMLLTAFGEADGVTLPVSCVVWNPFIEKAKAMPDFSDEQYVDMLCVEPGVLDHPQLMSGKEATFTQIIVSK